MLLLDRLSSAAAAAVLLAALAAAQTSGPFHMPKPMPPELAPESILPPRLPSTAFRVQQESPLRVVRVKLTTDDLWRLPPEATSSGELLVAISAVHLRISGTPVDLKAGETLWLTGNRTHIQNLGSGLDDCEFLLIQPKKD
jgi:hypothetical protein